MVLHALTVSYLGTNYSGWQAQSNAATIQGTVEQALAEEIGSTQRIRGASRTDAGVHARAQIATVHADAGVPAGRLVHGINRRLPPDIRILSSREVDPEFHPRFDAVWKEYHYRLERSDVLSPLDADRVVSLPLNSKFEPQAMFEATRALVGEHDFEAFALVGGAHTTSVRRILAAHWAVDGPRLTLILRGEGFLRGMVRSLVGTLIDIAHGRRSIAQFERLLEGAPRSAAGPTAPPHGLCLEAVGYRPGTLDDHHGLR